MRILIVILWDGGGVITAMRNVAARLRNRGVHFSAFCFNGFDPNSRWGEFCDELHNNSQISLTELLVGQEFDVVHMLEEAGPAPYSGNLWLDRAGFKGGVVCMSQNTVHTMEPEQFAHVYIACSEASHDFMRKFISSKPIRVIPNGVDTEHFRPRQIDPADVPPRPVLAWVGRSTDLKQKDVFAFLHLAAALADEKDPGYDFWIADADPENPLLRLSDWFGERIRYQNQLSRDQIAVFFNQVAASGGAVISTSAFEGLPFAMLEAAACGCPVIAPRAPGFEYIRDGSSGLLYDRSDGLAALKKCVTRLKDPAVRQALVDGSAADINSIYNSQTMADGYYGAFVDAIEAARVKRNGRASAWDVLHGEFYARAIRAKRFIRGLRPSRA
jgi:glycosyltransferase involved in cell wall biosynthesis